MTKFELILETAAQQKSRLDLESKNQEKKKAAELKKLVDGLPKKLQFIKKPKPLKFGYIIDKEISAAKKEAAGQPVYKMDMASHPIDLDKLRIAIDGGSMKQVDVDAGMARGTTCKILNGIMDGRENSTKKLLKHLGFKTIGNDMYETEKAAFHKFLFLSTQRINLKALQSAIEKKLKSSSQHGMAKEIGVSHNLIMKVRRSTGKKFEHSVECELIEYFGDKIVKPQYRKNQ